MTIIITSGRSIFFFFFFFFFFNSVQTNTALLSTLAGRCHMESGYIEVKGPSSQTRAPNCTTAFVERQDLFLPTLSVGEILQVS